jgi:four helix bundle protein
LTRGNESHFNHPHLEHIMSVHSLRIFRMAEEISDTLAVQADSWTPIHQDGLGRQIVAAADAICQHIRDGHDSKQLDDRLRFLRFAEQAVIDTRNDVRRAHARLLFDEDQMTALMRKLFGLSIAIVEFAYALMQREPDYAGDHRAWIERRRAWRLSRREARALAEHEADGESDGAIDESELATEATQV